MQPPAAAAAPSSAALAAARDALAVHGPVSRQEPIEWGSAEPLAPALAAFHRQVGPGWVEADTLGLPFLFFPLERLWDEQAGFRWSRRTGARLVDWNEDWTVVALQGGDPFIHEASTGAVLMAGEEGWEDRLDEPEPVFRDLAEMTLALCAVVGALEAVLGDHGRAVAMARRLGYLAAR